VFASAPKSILVLPEAPYVIDEGRIADFLVPELEWIDYTSTFFEGVHRLPPGHRAVVTAGRLHVSEYWRPQPGPDPGLLSDAEYREGFLDVFTRAVESRLRAPRGTAGSMLSGGMDSGSVVAVAKDVLAQRGEGPLPTFSGVSTDDSACAETGAIRAAAAMPAIAPTLIGPASLAADFDTLAAGYEEPFDGGMTMLAALYRAAGKQGLGILLDGAGGDIVLNEASYIARLLRRGQWRIALREIEGEKAFWGEALHGALLPGYLRAAFVPEAVKRPLRPLLARRRVRGFLGESLIGEDFARHVGIEARFARMRETFPARLAADYAVERCDAIRPNVTAGRERYARVAAAAGLEARDPFLDRRVVEFAARLPGRLLMRDGWPKIILRDLMAGRLPEAVRWCRGKPHLGWRFNAAVTREAIDRGAIDRVELEAALRDYINPEALDGAWKAFVAGDDIEPLQTARVLFAWLRENKARPVAARLHMD
jgi:asparagine synthase (glutamine-hydrolysing)